MILVPQVTFASATLLRVLQLQNGRQHGRWKVDFVAAKLSLSLLSWLYRLILSLISWFFRCTEEQDVALSLLIWLCLCETVSGFCICESKVAKFMFLCAKSGIWVKSICQNSQQGNSCRFLWCFLWRKFLAIWLLQKIKKSSHLLFSSSFNSLLSIPLLALN